MIAVKRFDERAMRTPTRTKRRCRKHRDGETVRARKILYWFGLTRSGLSYRDIAADAGLSATTIHRYTRPDWLEWARITLAKGPGCHAD